MRNKLFLSSIFHPFVCRTNRTGYLQFIQFFNRSFPAGDAPPRRDFEESTALCRLQRRKCYIELLHFCTAATGALRRATAAGSSYRIYSFGRPSADGKHHPPCQCAKRKFYPLVPRPPPERWHGCGYCCRIECTVGEVGVRAARAHHLHAGFIDRKNLFQKNHGRFFKSRVGIHQHMGGLFFLL